jgi:hypothetical protein
MLVLLSILVLFSLRKPVEKRPSTGEGEASESAIDHERSAASTSRARVPVPANVAPGVAVASAPLASAGSRTVHAEAPSVLPSEIQQETDPRRKAELMNKHRLAMARVKLSRLRHRETLLRSSLAQAKKDGSWTPEKIQQAETQLEEVTQGAVRAEENLEQVRQEVGGDIDR